MSSFTASALQAAAVRVAVRSRLPVPWPHTHQGRVTTAARAFCRGRPSGRGRCELSTARDLRVQRQTGRAGASANFLAPAKPNSLGLIGCRASASPHAFFDYLREQPAFRRCSCDSRSVQNRRFAGGTISNPQSGGLPGRKDTPLAPE